jgi:hypothetical protein
VSKWSLIPRIAKRSEKPLAKILRPVLEQQLSEFAAHVRQASKPEPAKILDSLKAAWIRQLTQAKAASALPMAVHGYNLAAALVGKKSFLEELAAKAAAAVEVDVELFGADELVANQLRPKVGEWIGATSKLETATSAERYENLFKQAMGSFGGDDSLTSSQLADEILAQGLTGLEARAELMARTICNWAYNEGARASYEKYGADKMEWIVTEDDATCDLCSPLQGVQIGMEEDFFGAGEPVEGNNGASFTPEWAIEHPPLHPNCRCCIAPVIEE